MRAEVAHLSDALRTASRLMRSVDNVLRPYAARNGR
jgi:hypothetical protein